MIPLRINSKRMKEINTRNVLNVIQGRSVSRKDLAKLTGLTTAQLQILSAS